MNAQTQARAVAVAEPRRSVLIAMATKYNMEPAAFEQTLRATVFPTNGSREQFAAFLVVANEYGLNPLTKEIYAFPTRSGGVQPIVSVDGWCNLINSHPQLNGIEFDDHLTGERVTAITARIWRKDREKPIVVTEYLAECLRPTDTWKQYPRRMLRHKALIQCARYAFGFAGIVDPDEAERMGADVSTMRDVTPARDNGPPAPPKHVAPPTQQNHQGWSDPPLEEIDRDTGEVLMSSEDEQWLRDVDGAFSSCESMIEFGDKQNTVMAPGKGKVSTLAWERAEKLALDAFRRVNQTVLDAG